MRVTSSREVYRNPWLSVREDDIELADGGRGLYGIVDKPDFALVIPRTADGGLWLVEQYRHPISGRSWEFPQGSWPPGADGSPAELAATELREETGLEARELRHLGHLFTAPGFCSQGFDVWLATGLEEGEPDREPTEQDMLHRRFGEAEFRRMVRDGEIVDAATLAAYTLLTLAETRR